MKRARVTALTSMRNRSRRLRIELTAKKGACEYEPQYKVVGFGKADRIVQFASKCMKAAALGSGLLYHFGGMQWFRVMCQL